MYAVVEFMGQNNKSSHEISIVPLIWLCKNDSKCYWPTSVGTQNFDDFVKNQNPYKKSWKTYKIFKLHLKTENYTLAEDTLKRLLEVYAESSHSSSVSFTKKKININESSSSDSEDPVIENPTKKRKINSDQFRYSPLDKCRSERPPSAFSNSSIVQNEEVEVSFASNDSTLTVESSTQESDQFSGLTSGSRGSDFERTVLTTLAKIHTIVEQHSLVVNELVRNGRHQVNIPPPENLPSFPVKTLQEFNNLERTLETDKNLVHYLTRRLAAVGGSGIDSLTRRIMKFLIANEVAVLFNWKGRDKEPFEKTKTMSIIYEAAKMNFPTQERNDYVIAQTVKDWLKFAKARLCSKKSF